MKKGWNAVTWVLILAVQLAASFGLLAVGNTFVNKSRVETMGQFLLILLVIWASFFLGVYAIGILGVVLKKMKPAAPGLRLATTALLTVIPLLILVFNAVTVGIENQQQFQNLVMVRMVPYYTQLCAVFSLLGFYVTIWWHSVTPKKAKSTP